MTTIIGAGLAGLIAGNLIKGSVLLEASETIPNNHSAVLRFRSSIVGDAVDIPFKQVSMLKGVLPWRNPIADQLSYALKCTGTASLRSSVSADASVTERWIAPDDLISQLAIRLGKMVTYGVHWNHHDTKDEAIISTIPMPALMKMLNWKDIPEFKYVHGFNLNCALSNVDAYVTLYVPGRPPYNRLSLTGDRLTIEYSFPKLPLDVIQGHMEIVKSKIDEHIENAMEELGLDWKDIVISGTELKLQKYSKILPIDDDVRKRFIMYASERFGIYSLGRYATWRPTLLLDDLINDIRVIKKLSGGASVYDYRR